ncbi:MAG: right-handed parallel beta-helix repeat-containing protein [Asticcacaulis sp.]|uniref:right-handed parallel beta-helix repeat-containing protein n=1 Tax=Asticcacaulis sp. TaxID=1872648 RepID=UPI0039E3604E
MKQLHTVLGRRCWSRLLFVTALAGGVAACTLPAGTTPKTGATLTEVTRADRLVAESAKMTDFTQHEAQLRTAMALYDQASLRDPAIETTPAFSKLLDAYTQLLIARSQAPDLPPEERSRILTTARYTAERYPDVIAEANRLVAIARRQIEIGDNGASADTLTAGYVKLDTLPPAQRDPLVADMTINLARTLKGRSQAWLWASSIADLSRKTELYSRMAGFELQAGDLPVPELAAYRGTTRPQLDQQSPALVDMAETLRVNGNLAAAATVAVAARPGTPQRDSVLLAIVNDAMQNEQRDAVEKAAFGISDARVRNEAIFTLAMGNAQESRISIAARLAEALPDREQKAQVLSEVAAQYADSHLQQSAEQAVTEVTGLTSVFMSRPAKSRINTNLARVFTRLGDYPKALTYARRVSDDADRIGVLKALAAKALGSGDWNLADKSIDTLKSTGARGDAIVLQAQSLAAKAGITKRVARNIEQLGSTQKAPATQAWVFALAAERYVREQDRAPALALIDRMLRLKGESKVIDDTQAISAALVYAYASLSEPEKAEAFVPDAMSTDSDAYMRALPQLAAAWARAQDSARLDGVLAWAINDKLMAKSLQSAVEQYAANGDYESAAQYATAIPDYKARVGVMHALAETSAGALDTYKVLDRQARTPRKADLTRDLILTGQGVNYYELGSDKAGAAVPAPPRLKSYTREMVSAKIPLPTEGHVYVIPMAYSYYNTKFVSQVNNTFRSIGEKVFPVQAQGTRYPRYIHIESGVMTLESLSRQLAEIGHGEMLVRKGSRYTLNVPLLVGPKASLVVSGTDASELLMNADAGVFIVNAGKLWFHDVTIAGWDSANKTYSELDFATREKFRPFIISWGGSEMNADGSHFHHLGFSGAKGYGFSYSQGPILVQRARPGALNRPTGTVVENTFENQYFGFFTNAANDVALIGNEYRNNVIYGVDPHDYSQRLLIAYNTSYGAQKKHGIIGSREVDDSWIVGNIVFGNHGTGVMLDRISAGNVVYANRVWGNGQEGLAVYESPCNIMAANTAIGNHGDGIKVRNSTDIGLFRNQLKTADRAGINVYIGDPKEVPGFPTRDVKKDPYAKFVSVSIIENSIDKHNGAGITANGFGALALKGNQFIGSNRKILQGDLEPLGREVRRLQDDGVVVRSSCPVIATAKVCRFTANGFMSGLVEALPAASGKAAAMCTGVADVDQETGDTPDIDTAEEEE